MIVTLVIFGYYVSATPWQVLNTTFTDNFKKVRGGFGNDVVILGDQGIYYSTNISNTTPTFQKYKITSNTTDSLKLVRCKFNDIVSINSGTTYFLCGEDTINHKAIVFRMNSANSSYNFRYEGAVNTSLNALELYSGDFVSVGNNGLMIYFSAINSNPPTIISSGVTVDLFDCTVVSPVINSIAYSHLAVGGAGKYLYFKSLTTSPIIYSYSGKEFRLLKCYDPSISNSNATWINDSINYLKDYGGQIISHKNFHYGPLQATDVFNVYVSTKHGLYVVSDQGTILEFDTTSSSFNLNSVYKNSSSLLVACGNNGLLIRNYSTTSGFVIKPFAYIKSIGGCVPSPIQLSGAIPSFSNLCSWFINGTPVPAGGCVNTPNLLATNIGPDTLMYIVKNGFNLLDTAIKIVVNTDTPHINLPKAVLGGNYICKQGSKTIRLYQTQVGVLYQLRKPGTTFLFGQGIGTGDSLDITTTVLDSTSTLYFTATQDYGAGCFKSFTDSVLLIVEHTKASFNSLFYNTLLGEHNTFYATSVETATNTWWFSNGASPSTAVGNTLNNIAFSSLGQSTTTLVATSLHGCKDTLIESSRSPFVVQETSYLDSCWANPLPGPTPSQGGAGYDAIVDHITLSNHDLLFIGETKKHTYFSQYGKSYTPDTIQNKSTLLIYSPNGTLKSFIHIKLHAPYYNSSTLMVPIFNVARDDSNYIYLTTTLSNATIYFPNGDSLRGDPTQYNNRSILLKLDSNLNKIWFNVSEGRSADLKTDHLGNVYWLTDKGPKDSCRYQNALGQTTTLNWVDPFGFAYYAQVLFKINSSGLKLWHAPLVHSSVNGAVIDKIKINSNYDIILCGNYESRLAIFNANNMSTPVDTLMGTNSPKIPLVFKLDSNGLFQWKTRIFAMDSPFGLSRTFDMDIDSYNAIYVGVSDAADSAFIFTMHSNQTTYISNGELRSGIVKLNDLGITQWIAGSKQRAQDQVIFQRLRVVDDKLVALFDHPYNLSVTPICYLYSQNLLDSVQVSTQYNGFCIAEYTLDGHINSSLNYGCDGEYLGGKTYTNIEIGANSHLSFAMNYYNMVVNPPNFLYLFHPFSDSVIHNNCNVIAMKVNLNNCGLKFTNSTTTSVPALYNHVFVNICSGTTYVFPNSTSAIINNDTVQYSHFLTATSVDSFVVTHINAGVPQFQNFFYTICAGQSVTLANSVTLTGLAADTIITEIIPLPSGCDSTNQYYVFVNNSGLSYIVDSVCYNKSYMFPNGFILNNITSTQYQSLFYPIPGFCDSVVNYTLYIKATPSFNIGLQACKNTTIAVAGLVLPNIQSDTVVTVTINGSNNMTCDTLLNYSIDVIDVNTGIFQSGNTLYSNSLNSIYQWLNCTTGLIIPGATQISYTPSMNGNYAVIVDSLGCIDTSACLNFQLNSIPSSLENSMLIYPNPATNQLVIQVNNSFLLQEYRILTTQGQVVMQGTLNSLVNTINIQSLVNGVYFIRIGNRTFKFDKIE